MELTKYHRLRSAVQANASPGAAEVLSDVRATLERALRSVGLFEEVEVDWTSDVDRLVIAMCTFPDDLDSDEVARRLETLWEDRLRYGFWEAHATLVDSGQVELEGATRTSTTGHFVTLHIVAQRAFVPAQRTSRD